MRENYSAKVLDHYHNPRHFGAMKNPDAAGESSNAHCGDELTVHLKVKGGKIVDIKWEARGCALTIAGASALSERIMNNELGIRGIQKMGKKDMEKLLGVKIGKARESCALMAINTIKRAIRPPHSPPY